MTALRNEPEALRAMKALHRAAQKMGRPRTLTIKTAMSLPSRAYKPQRRVYFWRILRSSEISLNTGFL